MRKNRGVTLIALVVTIIVLLILAVVSFRVITGDDGILNKAETSTSETERAKAQEQAELWIVEQVANYYGEGHSGTLVAYISDKLGDSGVKTGDYTIMKVTGGSAKVEAIVKVATLEGVYATETPQTLEIEVRKGNEKLAIGTVGATGKVSWEGSTGGNGSGSSSTESSSNSGTDSSESIGSDVFESLSCTAEQQGGKINVSAHPIFKTGKSESDVYLYIVYLNGVANKTMEGTNVEITGFDPATTYQISIVGIDKYKGIKFSSDISLTTGDFTYSSQETLAYPILTSKGMCNVVQRCDQGSLYDYYAFDPNVNTTASDSLKSGAYDGKYSTYCEQGDAWVRIDSGLVGKYVSFIASTGGGFGFFHWHDSNRRNIRDYSYWPNSPHDNPKIYSYQIIEGASFMVIGRGTGGTVKYYEVWLSDTDQTSNNIVNVTGN